jgi:A/G-specific adenine glycosylase
MDTNIRRVVQRLFAGPEDTAPAGEARLLALAQEAVPPGRGWAWNQAIMELGALICTAAAPACWRCPAQRYCLAYAARRSADEQLFSDGAEQQPLRLRRVAERREASYNGSNRFYRGRAIEALRQLVPGESMPLEALGRQIKQGFGEQDMPWLRALAEGLARDGLLALEEDRARLP